MNRSRVMWGVMPLVAMLGLAACVPTDSSNGAASSGILGERRSPEAAIEDNMLAMKLRSYYMRSDKVSAANINVSVYQGAVLLTGTAASQAEIDSAISIAKATRGVVKVHSELKVQHATFGELTKDAWYTNEVKIRILADEQVRGLDIHVETTKAVVYLTGTAQSAAERNRAVEIARQVSGVREVVSYIEIDPRSQPLAPGTEPRPDKKAGSPPPARMGGAGDATKPPQTTTRPAASSSSGVPTPVVAPPSGSLTPKKPGAPVESGF
ncbi:MAG: BON domain-containing protein [Magnetococcales bacterium]|nr:BON domain-containing protein [Magnetococcales bacterium]